MFVHVNTYMLTLACLSECRESNELKLYNLAKSVGADWRELAVSLGLTDVEVKIIEADVQTTVEQAYKMLIDWYWNRGSQVSFADVAKTIEAIQMENEALDRSSMSWNILTVEEKSFGWL